MTNNVAADGADAAAAAVVGILTSCHSVGGVAVAGCQLCVGAAATCPCAAANNKLQQRRPSDSRQRPVPCSTGSNQMSLNVCTFSFLT